MTTTVERKADGQIIYAPDKVLSVPNIDVMTMLFGKMKKANVTLVVV